MEFEAEVISASPLDVFQRRSIEKWLFYQKTYKKLYIDQADDVYGESYELIDGEQKRLYLNCRLTNPQKLEYNGGTIGYKFTIVCDSSMAWQDAITKTFTLNHNTTSSSSNIVLSLDTDVREFVYPSISVVMGSTGGQLTIANNTDDSERLTRFISLPANTTLLMDGAYNYVSGDNYEKFAYKNFIRLLDGENNITVTGNVKTITVEWQNMRYI